MVLEEMQFVSVCVCVCVCVWVCVCVCETERERERERVCVWHQKKLTTEEQNVERQLQKKKKSDAG